MVLRHDQVQGRQLKDLPPLRGEAASHLFEPRPTGCTLLRGVGEALVRLSDRLECRPLMAGLPTRLFAGGLSQRARLSRKAVTRWGLAAVAAPRTWRRRYKCSRKNLRPFSEPRCATRSRVEAVCMPLNPLAALRHWRRYGKMEGFSRSDQDIFQRACLQPSPRRSIWSIVRIVLAPRVGYGAEYTHSTFNVYPL